MGEEAEVHLKVRAIESKALTQVALVDLLPGGFELVIPPHPAADTYLQASAEESGEGSEEGGRSGAAAGQGGGAAECGFCKGSPPEGLRYADPRDDRVVFYATLSKDVQELVYKIKATNVGSYVLPPAFGEAMYDRSMLARSASGHIEVVRP
jgi:uncharacterized protein YfaS (alpha-2-macroglobulin family)